MRASFFRVTRCFIPQKLCRPTKSKKSTREIERKRRRKSANEKECKYIYGGVLYEEQLLTLDWKMDSKIKEERLCSTMNCLNNEIYTHPLPYKGSIGNFSLIIRYSMSDLSALIVSFVSACQLTQLFAKNRISLKFKKRFKFLCNFIEYL